MNSLWKVSFSVLFAIIFSFSALYFFLYSNEIISKQNVSRYDDVFGKGVEDRFYLKMQNVSNNKVYLLGSSQTGRLNATYIDEVLNQHGLHYEVYNLSKSQDLPKSRLQSIDQLIDSKPEIVVYGIGFRDFAPYVLKSEVDAPIESLPSPHVVLPTVSRVIEEESGISFNKFSNSLLFTIAEIKKMFGIDTNESLKVRVPDPQLPFWRIENVHLMIRDDLQLQRELESSVLMPGRIKSPEINEDVKALEEIVKRLKQNHIKIIIYTTPHTKYALDAISESEKQVFVSILTEISDKYDVPVYFLHDKYQDLKVWNDNNHVAYGGKNIPHNDDIANIISDHVI